MRRNILTNMVHDDGKEKEPKSKGNGVVELERNWFAETRLSPNEELKVLSMFSPFMPPPREQSAATEFIDWYADSIKPPIPNCSGGRTEKVFFFQATEDRCHTHKWGQWKQKKGRRDGEKWQEELHKHPKIGNSFFISTSQAQAFR